MIPAKERSRITRFKELARIEHAIEEQNETDLPWALQFCRMRLSIATRKDHLKHWSTIESRVKGALDATHDKEG